MARMAPGDPAPDARDRVTRALGGAADGVRRIDTILPDVYDELRRLAASHLRRERPDHTLQPTALANEAYLRLVDERQVEVHGRAHFFAVAARAMRRILVEHARARDAQKRGGDRERVPLEAAAVALDAPNLDVLDVEPLLDALASLDERKARVVEMRFYAGLTLPEVAEAVGVSLSTAEDDWYFARAWMKDRLDGAA